LNKLYKLNKDEIEKLCYNKNHTMTKFLLGRAFKNYLLLKIARKNKYPEAIFYNML